MIDHHGVLVHLDPKGDRFENSRFEFQGWVAAHEPIHSVWLADGERRPFTLSERPDVIRVFPGRTACGFSGATREKGAGLRIGIQIGQEVFEVEHPLPPLLPSLPVRDKFVSQLQLAWLGLRERLSIDPAQRWGFVLRRHLLHRKRRSNLFQRMHADALLGDFASVFPRAVFVQIGANDGFSGDPIYALLARPDVHWQGVLVEPVASLFAELHDRYADKPNLKLEQVAISDQDGTAQIHYLQTNEGDTLWLQQLASLKPEVLLHNAQQFGLTNVTTITEEVPTVTVSTLLQRHALSRLDLIVIDTEGLDWQVLRQFELRKPGPRLILYEHQHLSAEERAEAHHFLTRHGYDWAEMAEGDTIAWRS
jgi:FkbM family methyltransferase